MCFWFAACASFVFVVGFLMMTNSQGWMLPADGAHLAASMSVSMVFSGRGCFLKARMLLLPLMASMSSISVTMDY